MEIAGCIMAYIVIGTLLSYPFNKVSNVLRETEWDWPTSEDFFFAVFWPIFLVIFTLISPLVVIKFLKG